MSDQELGASSTTTLTVLCMKIDEGEAQAFGLVDLQPCLPPFRGGRHLGAWESRQRVEVDVVQRLAQCPDNYGGQHRGAIAREGRDQTGLR